MILIWFNLLKIFEITSVCKFNFETRTQETIQTSIPSRHSNKEKYFHFLIPSPPRPRTLYFCLAVVQSENSDHYCRRQDPGPGWRAFNGNFLFISPDWRQMAAANTWYNSWDLSENGLANYFSEEELCLADAKCICWCPKESFNCHWGSRNRKNPQLSIAMLRK